MKLGVILSRIAAASLAVLAFAACGIGAYAEESGDFEVQVNAPPKIAFLGDSITAGYGLEGYEKDDPSKCASYANILSKVFDSMLPEEAGFESHNLAINGLTSSEMLDKLKDGYYDKALTDADAVVVSIGGNDMLGVLFDLLDSDNGIGDIMKQAVTLGDDIDKSLEPYPETLGQITEEIHTRAHKSDCKLFIQTLYNPFEDHSISMLDDIASEKITKLNEIIFSRSENGDNYLVADVAEAFKGKNAELTNISSLDIHPNAKGHEVIAQTIEPLIEEQTYTYYDKEAEKRHLEAEREKRAEKKKIAVIAATVSLTVILAGGAVLIIRRIRN